MTEDTTAQAAEGGIVHLAQAGGICPLCQGPAHLSHFSSGGGVVGYDAKFCLACDVWLESGCGGSKYCSCGERPSRPSEVPYPLKVD